MWWRPEIVLRLLVYFVIARLVIVFTRAVFTKCMWPKTPSKFDFTTFWCVQNHRKEVVQNKTLQKFFCYPSVEIALEKVLRFSKNKTKAKESNLRNLDKKLILLMLCSAHPLAPHSYLVVLNLTKTLWNDRWKNHPNIYALHSPFLAFFWLTVTHGFTFDWLSLPLCLTIASLSSILTTMACVREQ